MKPLWTRSGFAAGFAIVAVLTLLLGRVASESRRELAAANAHRGAARTELAIQHYRRAIRWAFPLSPYSSEGASELASLANQLEAGGDLRGALLAWRSLSGGLAATRYLYSGSDPARENANEQIARLASIERGAAIDIGLTDEQLAADHRRLLSQDISPDPFWGVLLLAGMAVWLGALVLLAQRGFDSAGRFQLASARGPLWGALVGFASFALGLLFA